MRHADCRRRRLREREYRIGRRSIAIVGENIDKGKIFVRVHAFRINAHSSSVRKGYCVARASQTFDARLTLLNHVSELRIGVFGFERVECIVDEPLGVATGFNVE